MWVPVAHEAEAFGDSIFIFHDVDVGQWTVVLEDFGEVGLRVVFREVFDVDVVEGPIDVRPLGLVLKDGESASSLHTFFFEVVVVHLESWSKIANMNLPR